MYRQIPGSLISGDRGGPMMDDDDSTSATLEVWTRLAYTRVAIFSHPPSAVLGACQLMPSTLI